MPYANIAEQRAAKAASARRRRAERRGTVEPDAMAVQPTQQQLREAGIVLHIGRGAGESDTAYRERLRQSWQDFLLVVGP